MITELLKLYKLYMPNYYTKNRLLVNLFILSSIFFVIFESVIAPYFVGTLINNLNHPIKYIYYIIFVYFIVFILYYIKKSQEIKFVSDLLTYPRKVFFKAIIDKYSENYKSIKIGSNISKINMIAAMFKNAYHHLITEIIPYFIIVIVLSIIFLFINIKVGILLVITVIILSCIIKYNWKPISQKKMKCENYYYDKTDNNLVDIYTSLLNTYINNNESIDKIRIDKDQDNYNRLYQKVYIAENKASFHMFLVSIISFIIVIFYIIKSNIKKQSKIIFIILIIYFLNGTLSLSKRVPLMIPHYAAALGTLEYVKDILIKNNKINNLKLNSGTIIFKDVTFKYNTKDTVFKNINLFIEDKKKVAIVGKSGSGKSSLVILLLKLYKYQGKILIDNKNIQQIDSKYLRSKIIYCNQKTILYDIPVIDNIQFGNNISKDYINKILIKYDLISLFSNLNSGINSNCGVLGNNLSGGMQKVVLIMRAIVRIKSENPYIIIFDEPLAALDSNTRNKIIKLIIDYCKNKTLIVITHDKEILPYMDRIINFNKITKNNYK